MSQQPKAEETKAAKAPEPLASSSAATAAPVAKPSIAHVIKLKWAAVLSSIQAAWRRFLGVFAPVVKVFSKIFGPLSARLEARKAAAAARAEAEMAAPPQPKVPFKVRFKEWFTRNKPSPESAVSVVREINSSLISPDVRQSRAAIAFYINVFGLVGVVGLTANIWWKQTSEGRALAALERAKLESERETIDSKLKQATFSLGQFNLELKNPAGGQKVPAELLNIAEVEVVVECDSAETCAFIEHQVLIARNQLTNAFTAIDRDELLTKNGKRKLKMSISEALNSWLPKGQVKTVYFARLIIT